MKLLILATLVTFASTYPVIKTWTLGELSYEIEKSEANTTEKKPLIDALNQIMYVLFTGTTEDATSEVLANILSPNGTKIWSRAQLKEELDNPNLNTELRPYYSRSYQYIMINKHDGKEDEVEVIVPAMDISTWTAADIEEAMKDTNTKPALIPYLERAKEEMKKAAESGAAKDHVSMVTPVSLVPLKGENSTFAGRKYS